MKISWDDMSNEKKLVVKGTAGLYYINSGGFQ